MMAGVSIGQHGCYRDCESCAFDASGHDYLDEVADALDRFEQLINGMDGTTPRIDLVGMRSNLEILSSFVKDIIDAADPPYVTIRKILATQMKSGDRPEPWGIYNPGFHRTVSERDRYWLAKAALSLQSTRSVESRKFRDLFRPAIRGDIPFDLTPKLCGELARLLLFAYLTHGDESRLELITANRSLPFIKTPCVIRLRRFDRSLSDTAAQCIGTHKAFLMSGTILDGELFAKQAGIPSDKMDCATVGTKEMHNSVVFLVWNHMLGAGYTSDRENPLVPVKLTSDKLLRLIHVISSKTDHVKKVLVFADTRAEADRLSDSGYSLSSRLGEDCSLDVSLYTERCMHLTRDGIAEVDISYQRSSISRGSNHDMYDMCVLFGNGFQNGSDNRLLASISAETDSPDSLARRLVHYGKQRTVAQAAARIPRNGDKVRVVLLVGQFGPFDLPEYMRNRVLFVNELFESACHPGAIAGKAKLSWQMNVAAEWTAKWIGSKVDSSSDIEVPDRQPFAPPVCSGFDEVSFADLVLNHSVGLHRVNEVLESMGFVQASGEASRRGYRGWGRILRELNRIGVLSRDLGDRNAGKRLYHPGPYFGEFEKWCDKHTPDTAEIEARSIGRRTRS